MRKNTARATTPARTPPEVPAGKPIGRDAGETEFTLKASVHDNALFFRQGVAEAKAKVPGLGPVRVDLAVNIGGGSILVAVHLDEGKKSSRWRTYAFSVDTLVRAAIDKALAEPMPAREGK